MEGISNLSLTLLEGEYCVCRLKSELPIPFWVSDSAFYSITKTQDELSIVCEGSSVPKDIVNESGWRILKVEGPLDFGLVGILADITKVLASAHISVFAISTFDTDYILLKQSNLGLGIQKLKEADYVIESYYV